jgi:hypothetical protein
MTTSARALGRHFNIAQVLAPFDAVAGAGTGNRIHLKNGETCTFVLSTSAGSTDITDVDLQQATAATGGTIGDLDIITKYYYQSEATLDADETWTEGQQSAASEITDVGALPRSSSCWSSRSAPSSWTTATSGCRSTCPTWAPTAPGGRRASRSCPGCAASVSPRCWPT